MRSLLAQSGADLTRIVLVDSGSGDGGAQRLAASHPEVEIIALAENRSFAHAANTGVAAITEDLIFLLNPDTELDQGAVATLVEELEQRPQTAGVVPLLFNADGSPQHLWQLRRLPTSARLATGRSGAPAFSSPPTAPAGVIQPAAAAWLIRRDVWTALGGFDESFAPAWWEDVDFCARLADRLGTADFPVDRGFAVVPRARVRHQGGSSLEELDRTAFLSVFSSNLLRYAAIHHPKNLPMIRFGLRWSLAVRALARPRQSGTYLAVRRAI